MKPLVRRVVLGVAALAVLLFVAGTAFYLLLGGYELGPFAARRASAALGRPVSIDSLHITPGRWVRIDLRGARLDNLQGGSRPVMAEIGSLTAEVEVWSLVRGRPVVRQLVVDGLKVLLEHMADGTANWRFAPVRPPSATPANRSWFPALLDARGTGDVVIRALSGAEQHVQVDDLLIKTDAADQPVRLTIAGSYNGVPIRLGGDLAPTTTLRDATTPYPTDLRLTSGETVLTFHGTMTKPLDVDGAHGTLTLLAPTPEAIYRIAKMDSAIAPAIHLMGTLDHVDPRWELSNASGTLNDGAITKASLRLTEGARGSPDNVSIDLAFEELNLNRLLGNARAGGSSGADMPLTVAGAPDPLIDAKLDARNLIYAGVRATDVSFAATLRPGRVAVDVLSLGYLGAKVQASGEIKAPSRDRGEDSGSVSANVDVAALDVAALGRLLGFGPPPLWGRLDGQLAVTGAGATLNQAARGAHVSAVVTMNSGAIAQRALELASTDARTLFRTARGTSPISCAVGVIDVRAGAGTISPLRVRAEGGTITGKGQFDLYRGRIDLTISSERKTTSVFALDVPVRVSGALASPRISPAQLSASGRAQLAAGDDVSRLMPGLQRFASRSPCLSVHRDGAR